MSISNTIYFHTKTKNDFKTHSLTAILYQNETKPILDGRGMPQEVICVGVAYQHIVRAGCYLYLCYHIATLRCGSQSAFWHYLTDFRGHSYLADSITASPGSSPILLESRSSNPNQRIEWVGAFFFKRRFWTKSDKNHIYQCDRFYCLRFLTGIMKATVLFSHYSATHLISSVRSTKATQIFLKPPEHKHQHVLSHMQGPTLSSPQDKYPSRFWYEVEIYWGSIN